MRRLINANLAAMIISLIIALPITLIAVTAADLSIGDVNKSGDSFHTKVVRGVEYQLQGEAITINAYSKNDDFRLLTGNRPIPCAPRVDLCWIETSLNPGTISFTTNGKVGVTAPVLARLTGHDGFPFFQTWILTFGILLGLLTIILTALLYRANL